MLQAKLKTRCVTCGHEVKKDTCEHCSGRIFATVYPSRRPRKALTAKPKGSQGLTMARVWEEGACFEG